MDKYFILINQLKQELNKLQDKKNVVEKKLSDYKDNIRLLNSKNYIESTYIERNQNNLTDLNNVDNYYKEKKKKYLTTLIKFFAVLFGLTLLPNLLTGVVIGILMKFIVTLAISTSIVGGIYFITKKSEDKFFKGIDPDKLREEINNFKQSISLRQQEIEKLTKKVENLEKISSDLKQKIELKQNYLNQISQKREQIIEEILGELIEDRIDKGNLTLAKQKILEQPK